MDIKNLTQKNFSRMVNEKQIDTVILPLGSIEQHGDHLPFGTDGIIAEFISTRLGEKLNCFVLPCIYYGTSFEHDPLLNISMPYDILVHVISNICRSLYKQGIKRFYVLNGHHGNFGLLQYVGQSLSLNYSIPGNFFYYINYWQYINKSFDHAGEIETSIMLYICPEKVNVDDYKIGFTVDDKEDQSNIKLGINMSINNPGGFIKFTTNGVWGNPMNSSIEEGREIIMQLVEKISTAISNPLFK